MSLSDFEVLSPLGSGAYSQVFKVKRYSDGELYALKKVNMGSLSDREKKNALNEVRILASVKHPNIIAYKEAFFEGINLCIVMEYANQGDLSGLIERKRKDEVRFTEEEVWRMLIPMLQALQALHESSVLHRDLKSANVFIHNGIPKLGDLNVSKVVKAGLVFTQTGTPYYACPEVWRDKPYDSRGDIWSFGCVVYEMCGLQPPF